MLVRRPTLIGVIAAIAVLASAATAHAEGGMSIASAPTVVYGQQEFGDIATGSVTGSSCYRSFWSLPAIAGDEIVIDWEAQFLTTMLRVYPVGTNDFNLGSLIEEGFSYTAKSPLQDNGKDEEKFIAPVTGAMPMTLSSTCNPKEAGTYAFTAYVKHGLSVFLPRVSTLRHRSRIHVQVHSPDGGTVTTPAPDVVIEARLPRGRWRSLGRAPVTTSVATVAVRVPRVFWHRKVSLRATASGESYAKTRSRAYHVRVR